ncbi:Prolyl 3-hydroxylase ogfod1 [Podila horticola]|nr:Prolyl 3-hydroxylase ogfod1 [Podila horticola]
MSKHGQPSMNSSAPLKRSKLDLQTTAPLDPPVFNARYSDPEFALQFSQAFRDRERFHDQTSQAKLVNHPYPTASLPNFLESTEYLKTLREELVSETYFHKSNDLYEFYQSEDLRLSTKPHIAALKDAIYSEKFFSMMSSLTGIDLDPSVIDLNGNQYHEGCYLLCHDDDIKNEKEGRRIAFILYLVDEDWSAADGGALDLFRCNETGYPVEVAQSLVPVRNTLAFFELSSVSYHQVAEVLSKNKSRVSISGWFHGPLQTKLVSKSMPFHPVIKSTEVTLKSMLNPDYLSKDNISVVSDIFLNQSSIELQKFLKAEVYEELLRELSEIDQDHVWDEKMGPRHVRSYRRVSNKNQDIVPPVLASLQKLFGSSEFEGWLKKLTNLEFLGLNSELRLFQKGDYTLLHDHALEKTGLDVVFSFPALGELKEWDESWGAGATHYVADKANLLTLYPKHNTLTVVLRDEGTLRFIRFLTARVGECKRRELSALYTVNDEEDEEEEEEEEEEDEGESKQ